MNSLNWVTSYGGPLLLLGKELLSNWSGTEVPKGRVVESKFRFDPDATGACDYDRACDVEGYLGVLEVDQGYGLVLGDMPMMTIWLPLHKHSQGILLRWMYAPNDEHVHDLLPQIQTTQFPVHTLEFVLGEKPVLFDSALMGEETLQEGVPAIQIPLDAGVYRASTLEYKPDPETCLILHKLEKS